MTLGLSTSLPETNQEAGGLDPFNKVEVFHYILGNEFSSRVIRVVCKLFSELGFLQGMIFLVLWRQMSDKGPGKLYFECIYLEYMDNDFSNESEPVFKTTPITKPIEEAVSFPIYL